MKVLNNLDLNKNELQNSVAHKLAAAPSNPVKAQEYFNTTDNKKYIYDGSNWVEETSQGKVYTYQNGVKELTGADTGKVELDIATGDNAGNVDLTANANGLKANILSENVPSIPLSKISDVTATASELNVLDGITASTAELNILDGVTATASEINVLDGITATTTELNYTDGVTSSIQTQLDSKLAKKPDGTNDIVDSNNKITTTYLPDFILGQVLYGGNVTTGAVATLSTNAKAKLGTSDNSITLTNDTTAITGYEANDGIYYIAQADFTFASIDIKTGDWLISKGTAWDKIDNTDAVTGVKGNAESSYRIGNINITPANIGVEDGAQVNVLEGIQADSTDVTPTSKKVNLVPGTNVTMSVSGNAITINATATTRKYSATNPALTQSGGVATWTVNHALSTTDVTVQVFEVSTNELVLTDTVITDNANVTIKFTTASDISAGVYKVVVIG